MKRNWDVIRNLLIDIESITYSLQSPHPAGELRDERLSDQTTALRPELARRACLGGQVPGAHQLERPGRSQVPRALGRGQQRHPQELPGLAVPGQERL